MRTLVAWCPDWPVVAAGYPSSVPVAVVVASRVVACSAAARSEGIERGLRRREAQGRCPDLLVIPADPGRDARAFEPVAAAVESFTPGVEIIRPGLVAFVTRGPARYFGGDRALATKVAASVDATSGVPGCRVGVADGRFAAELAARTAGPTAASAAASADPAPAMIVPAGGSRAFLAPFSVATLERPELVDLLMRLGLRSLGELAALPGAAVLARFGLDGATAHRLARGLDERSLAARTPPPDLTVTAELDPPAERVDTAAFIAKGLADELHARLAALGLACSRVAIEAETEHGEHLSRLWRHEGALSAGAIAERVRWQLDGWLSSGRTTAGLTLLRLIPDEVQPDRGRQLGFWGGSAAAESRVARTLARIQGMLGPEAVVTAVMGGGRDPAERIRLVPWGDPREPSRPGALTMSVIRPGDAPVSGATVSGATVSGATARKPRRPRRTMGTAAGEVPPWPGQVPGPAPAIVHQPSRPAELCDVDGAPVTVTGRGVVSTRPAALSIEGGRWLEVSAWAGPWPVEERWWDAEGRRRARFQVGLTSGTAHLVTREAGRWWIEATYD